MRSLLAGLIALSCLVGTAEIPQCHGQVINPGTVVLELKMEPHRLARIEAGQVVPGADAGSVRWVNPAPAALDVVPVEQGNAVLLLTHDPGEYKLIVYGTRGGKASEPAWVTVTVKGQQQTPPTPPPTPPDPGPKPDPTPPVVGKLWVFVVEDPAARTAAQTKILNDHALWASVEAKGHRWRILPVNDPTVIAKGYSDLARKAGLPALILATQEGVVFNSRPLPDSADAVRNAVKEYVP